MEVFTSEEDVEVIFITEVTSSPSSRANTAASPLELLVDHRFVIKEYQDLRMKGDMSSS
jgi:hypothetical protein